jgi:hypothetical protein
MSEFEEDKFEKKIRDLEFEKLFLLQRNNLLEKQLESITNQYNDLKKELMDIEEHISFCKDNQLQLLNFSENEKNSHNLNQNNFFIFKRKIKTLFEYSDDFLKTNSETTIFNMIIDNIKNLQDENLTLRKTLEDLNNLIGKNKRNDEDINFENNYNNKINKNISSYNSFTPNEYINKNNFNYNDNIIDNIESNSYTNNSKRKSLNKNNNIYNFNNYSLDNNMSNENISYDNFNNVNNINDMNYINDNYGGRDVNSKVYFDELMDSVDNIKNVFK